VDNDPKQIPWFRLNGDIKIETFGRISAHNKHPNRILPYWVLGIVHSGERTVNVGNKHYGRLTVGEYFLLPQNTPHNGVQEDIHDVSFVHLEMSGEVIGAPTRINSDIIALPIYGVMPKDIDLMKNFQYIYHQYRSEIVSDHFLNIQLQAILSQMSFYMQNRHLFNNRNDKLSNEIFRFILTNLIGELSSGIFEQQFAMSYRQLNIIFKKQFKTTIKQKVIELRIDQAFNMLMLGESITGAAEKSGFKDYFYFLKCFKKIKSFTPKEMKRNYFR
jgi:AraC-like DNA-binding protein